VKGVRGDIQRFFGSLLLPNTTGWGKKCSEFSLMDSDSRQAQMKKLLLNN